MNILQYAELIRDTYNAMYENHITVTTVNKNNDNELIAWVIVNPESKISATIYAEDFYEKRKETTYTETAQKLHEIFSRPIPFTRDSINNLNTYEGYVEEHVYPILVNRKMNEKNLEKWAYVNYLDLIIIFKIPVKDLSDTGKGSITVTKDMLKIWNVETQQILEDSIENMKRETIPTIEPMSKVLRELSKANGIDFEIPEEEEEMFVITTKDLLYGANAILNEEFMEEVLKKHKNFRLIPSSIHEWILLSRNVPKEEADKMIREVNNSLLNVYDVLSDHIYFYNKKEGLSLNDEQGDN